MAIYGNDGELKQDREGSGVWCSVCNFDFFEYQEKATYDLELDAPLEHSRNLAEAASEGPPMRALYKTLGHAKSFVHLVTYGISQMHLGALKVIAQKVQVRGIISNADTYLSEEIRDYAAEAPELKLRLFNQSSSRAERNQPHQKLVVIDGLLAFKGSANLTLSGWRKAAIGRDVIEVVTDINSVKNLHNRLFSPIWAETNPEMRLRFDGVPYWSDKS
ncbi:MAG TPA: phospholipase D-like domain-containing protein [Nitrososphaera sp.]|nr:phospholipase D-like domain-containing protein [Nitrososphaera sp.]